FDKRDADLAREGGGGLGGRDACDGEPLPDAGPEGPHERLRRPAGAEADQGGAAVGDEGQRPRGDTLQVVGAGREGEIRHGDDGGAGFRRVLLLGMGGSSLCPEGLARTFGGAIDGAPGLLVLDSTGPTQIRAFEQRIDLGRTLFIVSSKSGTTLEPNIFKQYFFAKVKGALGAREAGRRFIAITDPGSPVERVAPSDGFRHVFPRIPGLGRRV